MIKNDTTSGIKGKVESYPPNENSATTFVAPKLVVDALVGDTTLMHDVDPTYNDKTRILSSYTSVDDMPKANDSESEILSPPAALKKLADE